MGMPHGSNLARLEVLGAGPWQFYACYEIKSCLRFLNKRWAPKFQEMSTLR